VSGATRLVEDAIIDEVVHHGRSVSLHRQLLHVPGDGVTLAVERSVAVGGAVGPVVLLIHGFAQNRFTWRVEGRSMVAALAEAGFDVWNVELRGHGLSRAAGAGNATSFDEYVRDVVRLVEASGGRPFIIGHSLGGGVGVGVAGLTELAGLVHLAGIYTFASDNPTLRALARITLELESPLRASRVRLSTRWAGAWLGRLYGVTEIAGYAAPIAGWVPESIERPLLEERLEKGFDWTSVEVWLEMARWASGEPFPYRPAFAAAQQPLLVLCGDHDPLVRERDSRACFDESGSVDKEFELFDAFHHQVHWGHVDLILGRRAPEVVWTRIIAWLRSRA
jgi:polyhydroxyalkanoate synthase